MNISPKSNYHAFTLVELLVVIVIIGILGSVITASLGSARKQARDAKRVADLQNISQALEQYYTDKGSYPYIDSGVENTDAGVCIEESIALQNIFVPNFLASIPRDPLYNAADCVSYDVLNCHCYVYRTQGTNVATKDYKIFAKAEITSSSSIPEGGVPTFQINSPTNGGGLITFSDLVGWWKFDEGTGTVANDSSGSGNTGAISGATWTVGKSGGALSFNGTSNYVEVADSDALEPTNITIAAWVKPASWYSVATSIVAKRTATTNGYFFFQLEANNTIQVDFGGSSVRWNTGYVPALGSWVHLAYTYDGMGRLYVNGSLYGSASYGDPTKIASTSPLKIGAETVSGRYFSGLIDDVRIYKRALTANEIARLYASY